MGAGELSSVVDQVIAQNPAEWERFCAGDARLGREVIRGR